MSDKGPLAVWTLLGKLGVFALAVCLLWYVWWWIVTADAMAPFGRILSTILGLGLVAVVVVVNLAVVGFGVYFIWTFWKVLREKNNPKR